MTAPTLAERLAIAHLDALAELRAEMQAKLDAERAAHEATKAAWKAACEQIHAEQGINAALKARLALAEDVCEAATELAGWQSDCGWGIEMFVECKGEMMDMKNALAKWRAAR